MKNNIHKLIDTLWKLWFLFLAIFLIFCINSFYLQKNKTHNEFGIWPGMLPDNKLYKIKLTRDKISEKIIFDHIKKIEFDLVMSNKTIYASKLLLDKGRIELARQTALKGENYFSMLVQDYNKALLENKKIPQELDNAINQSSKKHEEIFQYEIKKVSGSDKKDFQAAENFLHINTDFIKGLRSPKNKK